MLGGGAIEGVVEIERPIDICIGAHISTQVGLIKEVEGDEGLGY